VTTAIQLPASAIVGSGHVAGSPAYRRIVVALMAGGLANFSLMYFVQPLLPALATHYRVSAAESAHALSVTTLAIIAGLLVTGPLADRVGRVRVMRWSLLASGVLGLVAAVAPDWTSLVAVRGLLGFTLAGLPAAALAYLREEVSGGSHARANAAYIAGTAMGGAAARLLPGPLEALGGWPLVAIVVALVTVVAGGLMAFLLPPSVGFTPRRVEFREAVLGTLAALSDRVVALLCAVGFAAMGAFVGVYNAVAFRLQAPPFALGARASLVYLAYPIGIASPLLARALAARLGRGRVVGAGLALLAASVALLSLNDLAAVVVGLALVGFAFLGVHSMLSGWVVDRARRRGRGTAQASSAYLATYYLGSTIAGALATWLWQTVGWGGVALLAVGLACVAFVAAVAAARSDRSAPALDEAEPAAL
jgi:YNFM family putative membrane transporter